MNYTAVASISLEAIKHNIALIRQKMPTQKILAMVKSNAYGHGLIDVSRVLAVDALGVATIAEALQLRAAGITKKIVVMRGFLTEEELALFFHDPDLIACIHDISQIHLLEKHHSQGYEKLSIWLKIDTGMHRLGFSAADFIVFYRKLQALPFINHPFVICSHLAEADAEDAHFTKEQLQLFSALTRALGNEKSLLNSAGILAYPEAAYDWIRPGLMMYGVSPFALSDPRSRLMRDFCPVMTLSAKLIAIKTVKAGEKIGYGCTYTVSKDMLMGIVGMGYGDSYPRQASNKSAVLIQGKRCNIVGRVSMDMMAVDLTACEAISVGETVVLWNEILTVNEVAHSIDTISHELLCHLTGRVKTIYK